MRSLCCLLRSTPSGTTTSIQVPSTASNKGHELPSLHSTIGCIHAALILHSTIGCIHAALSDPLGRILASSALISGFEVPIPTICATHALLVLAILALHRAHASTTASNAQYPCTMILDLARQCVSRQCERRLQGWERGEGGTLSVSDCVVQLHSALSQCVMGRAVTGWARIREALAKVALQHRLGMR